MMRGKLLMTLAVWTSVAGLAAAKKQFLIGEVAPAAPPQPPGKATPALATDPAEPPLGVTVEYANGARLGVVQGRAIRVGPKAPANAGGSLVKVSSSARGTEVTLETPGNHSDTAKLTFATAAPMRFTMRLTKMPAYDLSSLSIASGDLRLTVGAVGTTETTKYFDRDGHAVEAQERFAFMVKAKRVENGQVEVQVHRGAGAALGKSVSVSWQCAPSNEHLIFFGGKG